MDTGAECHWLVVHFLTHYQRGAFIGSIDSFLDGQASAARSIAQLGLGDVFLYESRKSLRGALETRQVARESLEELEHLSSIEFQCVDRV